MGRKRATQAELYKRREEIQQLILKGLSKTDICERMSEKWNTTHRAISEDLRYIAKDWEEKATESGQLMRNKYQDRLELLYARAWEDANIKLALQIQQEINKLNGLYKEKEVETNKLPQFINISQRGGLKVVGGSDE